MPPLVVDVVTNHRAALLAREQAAMQEQARRWLGVEQAIQAQTDALTLELARDPVVTTSQLMRSRRWQALAEQTRDELHKYERYMEPRITDGQRDMITRAIEHSAQAINAVATEAGIVVPFNRLPVANVEGMVGLAGDGSPLRAILADASSVGPDALAQELVNGIALGRNPIEVARQAIRRGLGQSFTRMQAISRTEQLRVYRITSLQSYQNSRVVVGYRRLSARDDRVCAACLMADGQQYPIDHGFDEHVQGRCTCIPVLRNVPPVQYETGQEWFTRQPEGTQLAILGRGRFDLWRRGEATLDDMVSRDWSDVWGGSLRVTNVGRLRNGGGRVWQGGGPVAPRGAAPALRGVGPKGTPISGVVDVTFKGKLADEINTAAQSIDAVHGDGQLSKIPIVKSSGKTQAGMYRFSGTKAMDIKVSANGTLQQSTYTHEVGHWLDHQVLGVSMKSKNTKDMLAGNPAVRQAIDNYWAKIRETRSVKTLQEWQLKGHTVTGYRQVWKDGAIIREAVDMPVDKKYIRYLLDTDEVWARSYAQYIAERSGNNVMLKEVAERATEESYHAHWDRDDFAPVADAIDKIMEAMGWRG